MPVTLELGGKCPAILAGRLDRRRVGQADPRHQGAQERADVHLGRLLPGAARARRGVRRAWRPTTSARTCPASRSRRATRASSRRRHLERIQSLLADAEAPRLRRAAAGGGRRGRPRRAPAADVDRARPARRPGADAGGDLRADPAGEGLRRARRGGRLRERGRAAARAVRLREGRGGRRRRAAAHHLGRRLRQRRGRPRRAAVAAVRRHRAERLGPPPRRRGLPRVLQPARACSSAARAT